MIIVKTTIRRQMGTNLRQIKDRKRLAKGCTDRKCNFTEKSIKVYFHSRVPTGLGGQTDTVPSYANSSLNAKN